MADEKKGLPIESEKEAPEQEKETTEIAEEELDKVSGGRFTRAG